MLDALLYSMAVVGIAGDTHCSQYPATPAGQCRVDLVTKFVLVYRPALCDANHIRLVRAVNFRLILMLLLVDPFVERQKPGEHLGRSLSLHVLDHPIQILPQVARAVL